MRSNMTDKHLREKKLSSQKVFSGFLLNIYSDEVLLPDGTTGTREYALHPGAVTIIPFLKNGNVIIERQFRYPVGEVVLELPAGKIDAGEEPLASGKRELHEETGYISEKWTEITSFHPVSGYSNEVMHVFLAEDVTYKGGHGEEGEFVEVIDMPLEKAIDLIKCGEINDAKTLIGLFWAEKVRSGEWNRS